MNKQPQKSNGHQGFFSRPAPQPLTPIGELAARLEAFVPPPKNPELLELEARLRALRDRRMTVDTEYTLLCRRVWAHDTAFTPNTVTDPRPSKAELKKLEDELESLNNQIGIIREQVDLESGPWRYAYASALDTYSMESRDRFTDFIDELTALMKVFSKLAGTASALKTGSPWIMRQASTILSHCEMIRGFLQADIDHR